MIFHYNKSKFFRTYQHIKSCFCTHKLNINANKIWMSENYITSVSVITSAFNFFKGKFKIDCLQQSGGFTSEYTEDPARSGVVDGDAGGQGLTLTPVGLPVVSTDRGGPPTVCL